MLNKRNFGEKQELKRDDRREKTNCRSRSCMWNPDHVGCDLCIKQGIASVFFTIRGFVLLVAYPHYMKLKNPRQELAFAGAGLFGIVLYFMLENTALTLTYASNVGIIVACAPFLWL